jgi:hypothetical protein
MRDRMAVVLTLALAGAAVPAAAQDEIALKSFFEGKRVVVKIDMPGTSDGIDLHMESSHPLDSRYGDRLKSYPTAIRAGDSVMVTLVKLKKDLIEFQLAGGGFGTFGDDTSTTVYIPYKEKSSREKELDRLIKDEHDSRRKRRLEDERDDLRDRRERENRRIDAERARESARKRERVEEDRLRGGSRFNLRWSTAVPPGFTPRDVMIALGDYVDFDYPTSRVQAPPDSRVDVRSAGELPRKGMTRGEAERMYGTPIDVSEKREGTIIVQVLVFVSGDNRIKAEFIDDILVRYTVTPK